MNPGNFGGGAGGFGGGGGNLGRAHMSVPKEGGDNLGRARMGVPKGNDFSGGVTNNYGGNKGFGASNSFPANRGSGGNNFVKQYPSGPGPNRFAGMSVGNQGNQKSLEDYQKGWAAQRQQNNEMFGYSHH